jgi:glycerol-3-phosphate dehydrogenase (NAD(P)+)
MCPRVLHPGQSAVHQYQVLDIGKALKNVMAVAAGISDGLGPGNNASAAFVTRGLVQMVHLGVGAGRSNGILHGTLRLGRLGAGLNR